VVKKLTHSADSYSLDYKASKVCGEFHRDRSFVRGILGPVGSGKSVACSIELFNLASQQEKGDDGIRRSRAVIVRNTQPELETTTLNTWLDWFPENIFGKMNRKPPFTHALKMGDIEMEVIFLAMDRPEDTKKLLSLECTYIWFNEARQLPIEIIDIGTSRVGRYPSPKSGAGATRSCIIMDTNPPDDSHWWYKLAEVKRPKDWAFFRQPSGVSVSAENLENLLQKEGYNKRSLEDRRKHGAWYYERMISGKTKEWINVYVHGQYGFIQDGKPVYGDNYNDDSHAVKELKYIPHTTLYVGIDMGLTPAAVFGQRDAYGAWRIIDEVLVEEDQILGLPQFVKFLKAHINEHYASSQLIAYGDPAGGFRDQQGKTAFDIFRAEGLIVTAAPTNKFEPRRDAILGPLTRMVNGKPGMTISKEKCVMLRRGFNGGYKYKKLSVSGGIRYGVEPDKNRFSHPHDALQYLLSGGGEYREFMIKNKRVMKTYFSKEFSVW